VELTVVLAEVVEVVVMALHRGLLVALEILQVNLLLAVMALLP
jgi:hypothetical protein